MKKLLIAAALLAIGVAAHADWKMNPFTGKLDYYESGGPPGPAGPAGGVSDAAFSAAWSGVTGTAPSLNTMYNFITGYSGTAGITTLGTIVTGVWHGTAIADSYISSASAWNAKQAALTYPVTGVASPTTNYLTKWSGTNTLADGLKIGTFTDSKWCSYTTAGGLACTETPGGGSGDMIKNSINTMGSSGTIDGSAMSVTSGFKLPSGAGASPTTEGIVSFDTTTHQISVGVNGSNKRVAFTDSNISGTASNLSGTPLLPNGTTATTQTQGDNSAKLATTAYVDARTGGVTGMVNIKDAPYSAACNNSTDDTTAIQAALAASSDIYVPASSGCIVSNLTVTHDLVFHGDGASSIIVQKTGSTGYTLDTGGYRVTVSGLNFYGGDDTTKQAQASIGSRHGVKADIADGSSIDVIVHGFTGYGVFLDHSAARVQLIASVKARSYNNWAGLWNTENAEYVPVYLEADNNYYGAYLKAGNTNLIGPRITNCGYGVYFLGTAMPNNGHGQIAGGNINHSTIYSLYFKDITLGYIVNGTSIIDGDIYLDTSTGIIIQSGNIGVNNYFLKGGARNYIRNNNVYTNSGFTNTINHSYGGVTDDTKLVDNYDSLGGIYGVVSGNTNTATASTTNSIVFPNLTSGGSATVDVYVPWSGTIDSANIYCQATSTISAAIYSAPVNTNVFTLMSATNPVSLSNAAYAAADTTLTGWTAGFSQGFVRAAFPGMSGGPCSIGFSVTTGAQVLDQQYWSTGSVGATGVRNDGSYQEVATKFTAGVSTALRTVTVPMWYSTGTLDDLVVEIKNDTGSGPGSSILGTGTIAKFSSPTNNSDAIASPVSANIVGFNQVAGTSYYICIRTASASGTVLYGWVYNTGDGTNIYTRTSSSGSWSVGSNKVLLYKTKY